MYYIEGGGRILVNENKVFVRNLIYKENEQHLIRKRFDNTDCYSTIFKFDSQEFDKANLYGDVYFDLDYHFNNEKEYNFLKQDLLLVVSYLHNICEIPYEYINIYFSGCKGFHITVPPQIFGIEPCFDLNLKYKAFANHINNMTTYHTIDIKIYDRVRLFRLVNSIHSQTNLYKVPVTHEFIKNSSLSQLYRYAKIPHYMRNKPTEINRIDKAVSIFNSVTENAIIKLNRIKKSTSNKSDAQLPDCINQILISSAPVGSRNNTTVVLASALDQYGYDQSEIENILLDWNDTYNSPKLPEREIINTIKSAIKENASGKSYGCASIKDLGYCIGNKCRIYNARL